MRSFRYAFISAAALARIAAGQQVVSRADAVDAALRRGARLSLASADTAVAFANLLVAQERQNPVVSGSYSKSAPQYHLSAELPVDLPGVRGLRIESAKAAQRAAAYRFRFARAQIALDADTTYTRVQAASAHAALSRKNAASADTLLAMAIARRNAGDAAELDVQLATLYAGQQRNLEVADSLELLLALENLRTVMGLSAEAGSIVIADSLGFQSSDSAFSFSGIPLSVAAAQQELNAAELSTRVEKRSVFGAPSLMAGIETHDPSGSEPGILPTFGISIPIPLLNRNRGAIALAEASRVRASAELAVTRLETDAQVARATRERKAFAERVARDRLLLESANRVAAMSLTAYRAGAAALPNVFEAQRNARDVLAQYIDDVAAARIADSVLRLMILSTGSP
ncbi:MAG TPA: TolC family protein [Gemmatimonadaceae bacterium]|jgi:cobalt-zinc-cadmium efflux system outer membrane protein|nr:TolC family protein [Gemmatimonadaceae bacterium]